MSYQIISIPYVGNSRQGFSVLSPEGVGVLLESGSGYAGQKVDVFGCQPSLTETLPVGATATVFQESLTRMKDALARAAVASPGHPLPGWYGVWAYSLGAITEQVNLEPSADYPALHLGFYPIIVVTDHEARFTRIIHLDGYADSAQEWAEKLAMPSSNRLPDTAKAEVSKFEPVWRFTDYAQRFHRIQAYIEAGDCYQINLTQKFVASSREPPWCLYEALRNSISAPMGGYYSTGDWALLSLSPERFVSCSGRNVTTSPIKGTRPRAKDRHEDQALKEALAASEKDRAENLMIVDLLRNDLGKCCQTGSIHVDQLFAIETFHNVHHMVSTISGTLADHVHPLDLFAAMFPGGSITGAPKHRAMEIIHELEAGNRKLYCGSLIYCDVGGRLDSNILIRSLMVRNGEIECWAGGGIVADSTCPQEYQESWDKVQSLFDALSG